MKLSKAYMAIIDDRLALVLAAAGLLITVRGIHFQMPKTTTTNVKGAPSVTTEKLHGTVAYAEGNTLVVRTFSGDIKEFQVPPFRKFVVDGKELTVQQITPGTNLTATITTTTIPDAGRTTTSSWLADPLPSMSSETDEDFRQEDRRSPANENATDTVVTGKAPAPL